MKNFIEAAEKQAGAQANLANMLGITARYIRLVKSGERSFSNDVCITIADYIGADRLEVIAANNLVTEKDEKKRKIFESCFTRAATATAAAVLLGVTTIMTPTPVNASNHTVHNNQTICIMLNNRRKKGRRLSDRLNNYLEKLAIFFQRGHSLN